MQLTVARGELPARVVVHDPDGDWCIGDGVNDPNESGACIISAMGHVIDQDPSIASLASMPIGRAAYRDKQSDPWEIEPFAWGEELDED